MLSCGVAHKNSHLYKHTPTHTHQYLLRAIQHPQADGESLQGIGEHRQRLQHSRFANTVASFLLQCSCSFVAFAFFACNFLFIYVFFAMVAHFVHFAVAAKRVSGFFRTVLFFCPLGLTATSCFFLSPSHSQQGSLRSDAKVVRTQTRAAASGPVGKHTIAAQQQQQGAVGWSLGVS